MSTRGKPVSHSRPTPLLPELLHWPVLTSHPFVLERTPLPKLIHFYSFGLFMSWLFFLGFFNVFLLSSLFRLWMSGCVLGLCVFLRVCVFSPAASIDYGSFADRCSTWLELLRLKAHTIRRGSVKTSRRTHSLAHSGDHTYKFTAVPAHTCTHTHPSVHATGGGALSVKQSSPGFFGWVWKLKPHPPWWQKNIPMRNLFIFCTITKADFTHRHLWEWQRNIGTCGAKVFSSLASLSVLCSVY